MKSQFFLCHAIRDLSIRITAIDIVRTHTNTHPVHRTMQFVLHVGLKSYIFADLTLLCLSLLNRTHIKRRPFSFLPFISENGSALSARTLKAFINLFAISVVAR